MDQISLYFNSCEKGNIEKLKEIVENGFDLNTVNEVNNSTGIHKTVFYNQLECAKYLIEKELIIKN